MTKRQQFAKWLAQQLTLAAAHVAAWGGSHTTMTITEPDGTSATREWGKRSNDAGERQFMDCGIACVNEGTHQRHLPSCIIWQAEHPRQDTSARAMLDEEG